MRDRVNQLYTSARVASQAKDVARCRQLDAEAHRLLADPHLDDNPGFRPLVHAANHELTTCMATFNCAEAKRRWQASYRAAYPNLLDEQQWEGSRDALFYGSYPQCKP